MFQKNKKGEILREDKRYKNLRKHRKSLSWKEKKKSTCFCVNGGKCLRKQPQILKNIENTERMSEDRHVFVFQVEKDCHPLALQQMVV